jgi:hypothetical protein
MRFKLLIFCFSLSLFGISQESIHTTFGNIQNGISWTFSVGQTFIHEVSSTNHSVLPGVQQYFSFGTNQVDKTENEKITFYPNPFQQDFTVVIPKYYHQAKVQIYTLDGKLIHQEYLEGNAPINLSNNPSGYYLLKIFHSEKCIFNSTIIKL